MDLEQKAIERIKIASEMSLSYYGEPLICTYSGGKDSKVTLHLFEASGVPYELSNSHVTVDFPETVRNIRDTFREQELKGIKCTIDKHINPDGSRTTMWNLIPRKLIPPTRIVRYCCAELKEKNVYTQNRMIATGVRWDESTRRKNTREAFEYVASSTAKKIKVSDEKMLLSDQDEDCRRLFEKCELKAKTVVNPIIDWKEKDIWEYAEAEKLVMNPLYQKGFRRIGCALCPMAGRRERERVCAMYPKFKQAYVHAFDKMLDVRKFKGLDTQWKSGEEVFWWWMEDENVFGQLSFEDVWNKELLV